MYKTTRGIITLVITICIGAIVGGWIIQTTHLSAWRMMKDTVVTTRDTILDLRLIVESLEKEVRVLKTSEVIKLRVKTTAYSNDPQSINVAKWRDGKTASLTIARRGVVAADWDVLPLGTRLWVPGYGFAIVEDKGGAVKGMHIDVFFDSVNQARKWGVRDLEIIIVGRDADGK